VGVCFKNCCQISTHYLLWAHSSHRRHNGGEDESLSSDVELTSGYMYHTTKGVLLDQANSCSTGHRNPEAASGGWCHRSMDNIAVVAVDLRTTAERLASAAEGVERSARLSYPGQYPPLEPVNLLHSFRVGKPVLG